MFAYRPRKRYRSRRAFVKTTISPKNGSVVIDPKHPFVTVEEGIRSGEARDNGPFILGQEVFDIKGFRSAMR